MPNINTVKPRYKKRPRDWQNNIVVSVTVFSFITVLYHLQHFTTIGAKNAAHSTALFRGLLNQGFTVSQMLNSLLLK